MFMRIRTSLQKSCSEFKRDSEGSVASIFALSLVPLVGLVGAAVDYSAANRARTSLQAGLDAALLAGAKDGSTSWAATALNTFNNNVKANAATAINPVFQLTSTRAYTGTVTATVPSSFLNVLGVSGINVRVSGTVTVPPSTGAYYCVMALNRTAQSALQLTGNASITINAPKCVIQVNSSSVRAVDMNGNTVIKSVENCFVGGIRTVGNSTITPAPNATCKPIPDPFANYPRPTVGACDFTNYQLSGNQTVTLQPGVYCGGMNFSSHVNVTFAPGLYVIKDGVISESGGTFTGNGVSFFLTGNNASLQLSGQANWRLIAADQRTAARFRDLPRPGRPERTCRHGELAVGPGRALFRRHRVPADAGSHGQRHGLRLRALALYVLHRRYVALRRQRRSRHQQRYVAHRAAAADFAHGADRRAPDIDAVTRDRTIRSGDTG